MPNTLSQPQREAVRGLLSFLPALENTEPDFTRNGYWSEFLSVVSTRTAQDLYRYLYENGFVLPDFDWQAWGGEALVYLDEREKLQAAGWDTLYKLLTTHLRADRTNEGHYDAILENGFLRDVLRRMKVLLGE
jgi:hypothetical protein